MNYFNKEITTDKAISFVKSHPSFSLFFLYVIGFVIYAMHYSKYTLLTFETIRIYYLTSAIWWLIYTSIFLYASNKLFTLSEKNNRINSNIRFIKHFLILIFLYGVLFYFLISPSNPPNIFQMPYFYTEKTSKIDYIIWFLLERMPEIFIRIIGLVNYPVIIFIISVAYITYRHKVKGFVEPLKVLIFVLISIIVFSQKIFPVIPSSMGGGRFENIAIYFKGNSVPYSLRELTFEPYDMYLIGYDDDYFSIVVNSKGRLSPFLVSKESVAGFRIFSKKAANEPYFNYKIVYNDSIHVVIIIGILFALMLISINILFKILNYLLQFLMKLFRK